MCCIKYGCQLTDSINTHGRLPPTVCPTKHGLCDAWGSMKAAWVVVQICGIVVGLYSPPSTFFFLYLCQLKKTSVPLQQMLR